MTLVAPLALAAARADFADEAPPELASLARARRHRRGARTAIRRSPGTARTNVKWKVPIEGRGSASPIVWGDASSCSPPSTRAEPALPTPPRTRKNFTSSRCSASTATPATRSGRSVAREAAPHEQLHETNTYASGSPTTDGKLLYASFGSFGIYCYDLDGNRMWERDLGDMHTRNEFGEGVSPTIHGDTLIVNWDQEGDSFIYRPRRGHRRDEVEASLATKSPRGTRRSSSTAAAARRWSSTAPPAAAATTSTPAR